MVRLLRYSYLKNLGDFCATRWLIFIGPVTFVEDKTIHPPASGRHSNNTTHDGLKDLSL